jgi:glycerol-3-phosphate dehydrogenase
MEPPKLFSALNRNSVVNELEQKEFDLVIIGGGISGAGIALDAASRGLSVAMFDKGDFGFGTSSRSTKLVHGGLRYLAQLEFFLVMKLGLERDIVYENAAHLVYPENILLPFREKLKPGKFILSIGLMFYDILAKVKNHEKHIVLSKEQTKKEEPLLKNCKITGSAKYYEYKCDDARLTLEIIKKCNDLGVKALNYCDIVRFFYEDDLLNGVLVNDSYLKRKFKVKSKYIINATGPWVDELRNLDNSLQEKKLKLTKGVHIVVPKEKVKLNQPIYFTANNQRMIFIIPRFDTVYIGTTDTNYSDNKDKVNVRYDDVVYLINAVNDFIPDLKIKISDIISSWAGLRPLIHKENKKPSEISRKDEIIISKSGLISIAGGKLTGYRLMAKKVINYVFKILAKKERRNFIKSKTKKLPVSGSDFTFPINTQNLIEFADYKYDQAKQTGISVEKFKNLFYRYGTNIDFVTERAYFHWNLDKNTHNSWLKAEIEYSVNHEMTLELEDFFIRRTSSIYFHLEVVKSDLNFIADEMMKLLGWSEIDKSIKVEKFKNILTEINRFD